MNLNIIKQVFIFPILTYFQNPKDTHCLDLLYSAYAFSCACLAKIVSASFNISYEVSKSSSCFFQFTVVVISAVLYEVLSNQKQ